MSYDVIVIGGSYAGMAAALQLLRAYKKVLIIDAGERRNRFASHSHGFLGQDGIDPSQIAAQARLQLEQYSTLTWHHGTAQHISGQADHFEVRSNNQQLHQAKRIILAFGVRDLLPTVIGIEERWGKSVFHCPYCHGYELTRGKIGVIATGTTSIHQAELLSEWGDITLLVNNTLTLTDSDHAALQAKKIQLEHTPIAHLSDHASVVLHNGKRYDFAALFTTTHTLPASNIAATIGCTVEDIPTGQQIQVNVEQKSSVPGIFACGDAAHAPHSISFAVGNGAFTGFQVHRSLIWPHSL